MDWAANLQEQISSATNGGYGLTIDSDSGNVFAFVAFDAFAAMSGGNSSGGGGTIASYKHQVGPKEAEYYSTNKGTKKIANDAAWEAGMLATDVSGDIGGDNDGYSGAIRHAYWMYLIAVH